MLWAWELKEFKLSRELSLLCTPPPPSPPPSACPPLRWCCSSRSAYQLSPNPLSRMLLSFRLGVSCRAFYASTNTQIVKVAFTIQPSRPHLHLWVGVIMGECVFVCVYRRGLKSVVTYCKHTLHCLKEPMHVAVELEWCNCLLLSGFNVKTNAALCRVPRWLCLQHRNNGIAHEPISHFNQHGWR